MDGCLCLSCLILIWGGISDQNEQFGIISRISHRTFCRIYHINLRRGLEIRGRGLCLGLLHCCCFGGLDGGSSSTAPLFLSSMLLLCLLGLPHRFNFSDVNELQSHFLYRLWLLWKFAVDRVKILMFWFSLPTLFPLVWVPVCSEVDLCNEWSQVRSNKTWLSFYWRVVFQFQQVYYVFCRRFSGWRAVRTKYQFFSRWGVNIYCPSRGVFVGRGGFFFRVRRRLRWSWVVVNMSFCGTCLSYNNKIIQDWLLADMFL